MYPNPASPWPDQASWGRSLDVGVPDYYCHSSAVMCSALIYNMDFELVGEPAYFETTSFIRHNINVKFTAWDIPPLPCLPVRASPTLGRKERPGCTPGLTQQALASGRTPHSCTRLVSTPDTFLDFPRICPGLEKNGTYKVP